MPSAREIEEGLRHPIRFAPVYQQLVWGGRRMALYRDDLPRGDIGESWEISQQPRGISKVAEGPLAGMGLDALMAANGRALVGSSYDGGDFPLLIKLIDARDRLSVQVHPDDAIAQRLGVGQRGKTECWYLLGDGGELFQGTPPGVDRETFAQALERQELEGCLNRFETRDGDFFFMPARTVHALGRGCLLFEIQQSCDCTFRVYDWGRTGLDGKPRPLHVEESLRTIDFGSQVHG
ncbi:MAG: type I phosphomannose isomerase catalytic subunit, partial [Planctomycetota bacterium]